MTKNEFDLLNYVSACEHVSLSDIHASEHFIKAFSGNFIVMDLVIGGLVRLDFLKPDPLPNVHLHLDPYTVFTLTPAGAHAMDEYSEHTSRLDRAEKSAFRANVISIVSVVFAAIAAAATVATAAAAWISIKL